MQGSKLFKVLAVLGEREWKELFAYLSERYHSNAKLIVLFHFIFKRRANLSSKKLSMDEVRTTLFGFKSEKYIRNLMSQLYNQLENFLVFNEFSDRKNEQKLYLFNALNKRGLYDLANNCAAKFRSEWSDLSIKDHRNIGILLQLNHDHFLSNNPIKLSSKYDLLSDLIISFNSYRKFLTEYYQFILLNVNRFESENEKSTTLDSFGDLFNQDSSALITVGYLIKILEQDEQAFKYLFRELCSGEHNYSEELSIIVYMKCRDFIYKKLNDGQLGYTNEFIYIIDIGINEEYLLYKGQLSSLLFYNIFSTACGLGELTWARNYLKKYIGLVPKAEIESVKKIAAAELNFSFHKYHQAINVLNRLEVLNLSMKFKQRLMLVCSYYVTYDEYFFIDTQLNNYNQFFYYNKSKLSRNNFEGGLNLGKILRQLVNHVSEQVIMKQIETLNPLAFRLRLPTIIEQRKIYVKKHGLN